MARPWAFRGDRERLHALSHEAQRFGERTREVAQRAQFANVLYERTAGSMIQRATARRAMLEERQYAVYDCLQRNGSILGGCRDGVHQRSDPGSNLLRLLRPLLGVGAVVVRRIAFSGAHLVALDQARE